MSERYQCLMILIGYYTYERPIAMFSVEEYIYETQISI